MTTPEIKKASLDPGFGGFKAAAAGEWDDPNNHVVNVPAIVGIGEKDVGMLFTGGNVIKRHGQNIPYTVTWGLGSADRARLSDPSQGGETQLLVGAGVHAYGRPIERLDFDRLRNGPELRALTYTALGLLFGPGETTLSLVVGLPVELLAGGEAKSVVRGLRKWLIDRHTFTIDGAFYIMNIEQVKPAPQPLGTYLDWGFDRDGQWKKSKADLALPVGVLDIGFNSVDLFAVKDGAMTRRYTSGRNLGVRRSVEIVKEQIHRDYGIDQSYGEIDDLIREYVKTKGRTVRLAVPGGSTNANENVDLAINMAAGELTAFVESQWGNGSSFSHILLTGGGSIVMGRFFARSFPHAEIMPAPAEANARGLAKLAARQGFLRG